MDVALEEIVLINCRWSLIPGIKLKSGALSHAAPPLEMVCVPSSMRSSQSPKCLSDLSSKGGCQQEFHCMIRAVGRSYQTPFFPEVGKPYKTN